LEPEYLLPCSQQPAICPYCKIYESTSQPPTYFCKMNFNLLFPYTPRSSQKTLICWLIRFRYVSDCYLFCTPKEWHQYLLSKYRSIQC
jgi:hypothetical protein